MKELEDFAFQGCSKPLVYDTAAAGEDVRGGRREGRGGKGREERGEGRGGRGGEGREGGGGRKEEKKRGGKRREDRCRITKHARV